MAHDVMSLVGVPYDTTMNHVTCKYVMSRESGIWWHGTSCHLPTWLMTSCHLRVSHVIDQWRRSRKEMIRYWYVTVIKRHWYLTRIIEISLDDMTHSYGNNSCARDSFLCVTCLSYTCDMPHLYVWHASVIRVTWLIHMGITRALVIRSYVWHASFIRVTCLIHKCDMTHPCVWHDSFICVTCLIYTCDMPHSYLRHDSCISVTSLIFVCDMNHSNV